VVIDELIADGAALEFASHKAEQQPLQFSFHNFVLNDVGIHGPASFRATLTNPTPPGEITTSGKFGPWNSGDVGKTQVSGEYGFQHADLGVFHGVAGELSSSGNFSGELNHIDVQGTTDTPAFSVTSSSHKVDLRSQFHAVVNGENGDTFLQQVAGSFGKTTVLAMGSVAEYDDEPGKLTSLEFTSRNGRIQDLLLLFARAPRTPMSGTVSFHAKVSLPYEKRPFLQRVQLQGDFGIDAGSFSKPDTQESVNHLSQGALSDTASGQAKRKDTDAKDRGAGGGEDNDKNDPAEVLSDLKGHVVLKDATAQFSNLSFSVPGAVANLHGTYNLISEKIDLRGTLKTDSDPSKTTHGVKSVMLKVLDPFFKNKNKNAGYDMPVKITGTYDHPLFGLDLHDSDEKKRRKETERAAQLLKGKP
jgi:hypothetical protein